jgi:hypothetical protein
MQALPVPIDQSIIPTEAQYYSPSLALGLVHDEHVPYRQLDPTEYLQSNGFVGLPGASHHELLQLHNGAQDHGRPVMEAPIDPILLPYENQLPANLANMSSVHLQPNMSLAYGEYGIPHYAPTPAPYAESNTEDIYDPSQQEIKYAESREWRPESNTGLEQPEFDNYWPGGPQVAGRDHDQGLSSTHDEPSELHSINALLVRQNQSPDTLPLADEDIYALPSPQEDDYAPPADEDRVTLPAPKVHHVNAPINLSHLASIGPQSHSDAKDPEDSEEKSPKTL